MAASQKYKIADFKINIIQNIVANVLLAFIHKRPLLCLFQQWAFNISDVCSCRVMH